MSGRIIYYGVDEYYRLRTLRDAGYTVHTCGSLSEFKWILYSGGRAHAVAFAESVGRAPHSAISLARSKRSPLVLFQGWTPHYDESQFDLVIPMLTSADQWLGDIASLIGTVQTAIQASSRLRSESRMLRDEASAERQRTKLELFRSKAERERNRGFNIDFLRSEGNRPDFGVIHGLSRFLTSLDAEALHEFRSLLKYSVYPPGTVLFTEAELPHETYFLFTGNVKLSVNSSEGRRFIVHIANPGEVLGLASALTASAHAVTAETGYTCEVGSIDSSDFLQFLDQHPAALRAAAAELGHAYNQVCARLGTVGVSITVMAKMARFLLEWPAGGNEAEPSAPIHMALTHTEIGQCIGASRESVTRALRELQERRIIDQKGSVLTILDRAALESCAGVR